MATRRLTFVAQAIWGAPSLARARAKSGWYESEVDRSGTLKVLQVGGSVPIDSGMPKTRHGGLTDCSGINPVSHPVGSTASLKSPGLSLAGGGTGRVFDCRDSEAIIWGPPGRDLF
jgi:hypothetical protein